MLPPHVSPFKPQSYPSDWHVRGTQTPPLLPEKPPPLPEADPPPPEPLVPLPDPELVPVPEPEPPLDPDPPLLAPEPLSDVDPDSAPSLDPELLAVVASLERELLADPDPLPDDEACAPASLFAVLAIEPPHPPAAAPSAPSPSTTRRLRPPCPRSCHARAVRSRSASRLPKKGRRRK
jgi:periplasmic protein TonB